MNDALKKNPMIWWAIWWGDNLMTDDSTSLDLIWGQKKKEKEKKKEILHNNTGM